MRARFALLCAAPVALGCNAIFGIHDPPVSAGQGGSGGSSTAAGSSGAGGRGGSGAAGGGSGGAGGSVSGDAGAVPPAESVSLRGTLRRFESGAAREEVVNLAAYEEGMRGSTASSAASGDFTLDGVERNAAVELELTYPPDTNGGPLLAFRQTRVATLTDSASVRSMDLPVVDFSWLADTADECGAVLDPTPGRNLYFNRRSTVIVQVFGANGQPAAGIPRQDVEVRLTANRGEARLNTHLSADDPDANKTFVCVLESGDGGDLAGGTRDTTTSLGTFVVFRVRNAAGAEGTGEGVAEVSIRGSGYSAPPITLRQSGQTAVVRIGKDW